MFVEGNMVLYDATIGNALHLVNTAGFVYYILWVGLTPFVDSSHFSQRFFLPREYGVALAAVFLSLIILVAVTSSALHIIGSAPAAGGSLSRPASVPPPMSLPRSSNSRADSTPSVSDEEGKAE
jgi:dolichyl-phosphate mannosyltransferase polypeptide 2 regulatory subunit